MARNGSGTYSLPAGGSWYPAVNAVSATVADWNTLIADVASALTSSVAADGQTVMSGNLNFNSSYRPYNVANASATGHPVVYGQGSWSLGAGTLTGTLTGTAISLSATLSVGTTSTFTGVATFTAAPVFTDAAGTRTALSAVGTGATTTSGLTMATARILGRTTAGTGAIEEISVGTGLSLSAGSLTATGSITLLATQASTSGTAITFTGIPATAKRVTINLSSVSTSGTSVVCLRVGSGSINSSGYLGSSSIGGVVTVNTTYFGCEDGANAAAVRHGILTLTLLEAATNTWAMTGLVARSDVASITHSGGSTALAGALDRISITTVGGADTFDAGKINVMYE